MPTASALSSVSEVWVAFWATRWTLLVDQGQHPCLQRQPNSLAWPGSVEPWTDSERLLVLLPAWNEELGVVAVVKEVHAAAMYADVLVIDDGSTDRTADVAASAGARVLRLPHNLGVGGAMRAGYRYAMRYGYGYGVQVDADGQHDPAEIPRLIDQLAGQTWSSGPGSPNAATTR